MKPKGSPMELVETWASLFAGADVADPLAVSKGYVLGCKASLVSRIWRDTLSVIPAKAGIQLTLLWIPASAGKTIVGKECRTISPIKQFTRQSTWEKCLQ